MTTPDSPRPPRPRHGADGGASAGSGDGGAGPLGAPDPAGPSDRPSGDLYGAKQAAGPSGLSPDELVLRSLMRDAVRDLSPAPDALGRLRRTIPVRQFHRRQAVVGAAAACVLAVVAIPAVLRATGATGAADADSASVSSARAGAAANGYDNPDGSQNGGRVGGVSTGGGTQKAGAGASPGASPSPGASGSAGPSGALTADVPLCTASDLGNATGGSGDADSSGRVTGYFTVVNVSTTACTVGGQGDLTAAAQGGTGGSAVLVVQHTSGDKTGLSDASSPTLVLQPGQAYEVDFAWVPDSGGDSGGCPATSGPSPSDSPTGGGSDAGTGGGTDTGTTGGGATSQASNSATAADDSGTPSVTLTYTADPGSPTHTVTLAGACSGTVYRTGLLAAR